MGRVKESGSGYVLAQLSNSIIGVKDENKKEQKVWLGVEDQDSVEIDNSRHYIWRFDLCGVL